MSTPISTDDASITAIALNDSDLSAYLSQMLEQYFVALGQDDPVDLYRQVVAVVEKPLLDLLMKRYRYSQSRVAQVLGLSRGTTRAKLRQHFKNHYVGSRDINVSVTKRGVRKQQADLAEERVS